MTSARGTQVDAGLSRLADGGYAVMHCACTTLCSSTHVAEVYVLVKAVSRTTVCLFAVMVVVAAGHGAST
jgi:hypothetical protein